MKPHDSHTSVVTLPHFHFCIFLEIKKASISDPNLTTRCSTSVLHLPLEPTVETVMDFNFHINPLLIITVLDSGIDFFFPDPCRS